MKEELKLVQEWDKVLTQSDKVNDKKVEYYNVNNGMIGFNLEKELNNIEIEFNAPLLKAAKIISLCGIIMLFFVIIATKKRKKY